MDKQQTKALKYNGIEAIKGFARISIKKPVLRTSEMLGIPYSTLRRWKSKEKLPMKYWRVLLDESHKFRQSLKLKLQTFKLNSSIKKTTHYKSTAEHFFYCLKIKLEQDHLTLAAVILCVLRWRPFLGNTINFDHCFSN